MRRWRSPRHAHNPKPPVVPYPSGSPATTAEFARDMLLGISEGILNPHKPEVDGRQHPRRNRAQGLCAITDKRLRRVWAILIGLTAVAVTVGLATIVIHDRIH